VTVGGTTTSAEGDVPAAQTSVAPKETSCAMRCSVGRATEYRGDSPAPPRKR
jgi:hypothetical protein